MQFYRKPRVATPDDRAAIPAFALSQGVFMAQTNEGSSESEGGEAVVLN